MANKPFFSDPKFFSINMQGQCFITITNKCHRKVSIKLRLVYPVQWIFLLSIPWLNTGSFRAFGIQLIAGCIFGRLGRSESCSHLLFNNNWSAVDSYLISIHQGDNENLEMLFRSARTSCTSFHGPVPTIWATSWWSQRKEKSRRKRATVFEISRELFAPIV